MKQVNVKKLNEKVGRLLKSSLSTAEFKSIERSEFITDVNFDALYLWVLMNYCNFPPEKLLEIFKITVREALKYKKQDISGEFIPEVEKLKEMGVDVEKLTQEAEDSANN